MENGEWKMENESHPDFPRYPFSIIHSPFANKVSMDRVADLMQAALGNVQLAQQSAYNRAFADVRERLWVAERALMALRDVLSEEAG
jgi:hypothetical protein